MLNFGDGKEIDFANIKSVAEKWIAISDSDGNG